MNFVSGRWAAQAERAMAIVIAVGVATASVSAQATPAKKRAPSRFERPVRAPARWYKGNTHAHTTRSDGDSPPEVVAMWYKTHGYSFLVLSDHNVLVDPATLSAITDTTFLLIPGEELTTSFQKKPVHVNGLNIPNVIEPLTDSTLLGTIQKNVDAVRDVDGVPHINHPNFGWAFDDKVLAQVKHDKLLEIFNGHPLVNNLGGGGHPGLEEIWDRLLTGGMRIYGIAVDDAHHFKEEFAPDRSNPGRGWIVIRADSLKATDLLHSLEDGLFYASTGVDLDDIIVGDRRLELRIRERKGFAYTTEFIGSHGRVLARSTTNPAVYTLRGGEGYVRAKVIDSGGFYAWIQPQFVTR